MVGGIHQGRAAGIGVADAIHLSVAAPLLAAVPARTPPLVSTFAAISLILFLGFLLMVAVVVGARSVRRLNRRPSRPSTMASDRWYEKPLVVEGSAEDDRGDDSPAADDGKDSNGDHRAG